MDANPKANGFSLVEIMMAMMIMTVIMLAMAASSGYIASEIRNSTWNTQRAFARNQIIEQLRAIPFDSVATNTTGTTVGRFTLRWVSTSVNSNLKTVSVIAVGDAYRKGASRTTVTDTVVVNISRP